MPLKKSADLKTQIVNLFKQNSSTSIKFNALCKLISLNRSQKAELREVLHGLTDEKYLVKNGKYYELWEKGESYEGTIVLDKDNEYSVEVQTEDGFDRLRVRKKNLLTALTGDTVKITIVEFSETNEREAIVEEIIKRAKHSIVGKLQLGKGYAFVVPDDRKFRKDIY